MASLPYSIPESWLSKTEAEILDYTLDPKVKRTLSYIDTNESMFNFSTSNIRYSSLQNLLGLRLEGFLLRLRFVVYTVLIVALTAFPLACLLTIFLLEFSHLIMTCYYTLRYKYAKNWFLLASKINVGIAVMVITSLGAYIVITSDDPSNFQNRVNPNI